MNHIPFHLAIGVNDLEKARWFYGHLLGSKEGRSDILWVDFHFFGHQLTCHLIKNKDAFTSNFNEVDNEKVPIPHFGVIVSVKEFECLENRIKKHNINFIIEPQIRFKNKTGEQKTMFFKDPFGHSIEIKSFIKEKEY